MGAVEAQLMNLDELEIAPCGEVSLTRDDPVNIAPDSPLERGWLIDDEGQPIREARLRVLLEKDGEVIAVLPVDIRAAGFLHQLSGFEAPAAWDEAWLTDGRVRVRAGHGGPAGYVNGMVWK